MDFSIRSNHGTIESVARAPVKRRLERPSSQPSAPSGPTDDGRRRVVIEDVSPQVDGGRFPAKRTVGEKVAVEADIFADGHDAIAAALRYRHQSAEAWTEVPMILRGNDRWHGEFPVSELGVYKFTVEGWIDRFGTWSKQFAKRVGAGQDVTQELEVAAKMVAAAA